MSEYQYVHFVAVDRPLDDKQLDYMENQSTRAEISRWGFTNEYHYSDFRGDEKEMLRRGYDVHLHFANYGIRKLMIRLPELPCDSKTFTKFQTKDKYWGGLVWEKDKRGSAGILTFQPEADAGTYDYLQDVHSMLSRLAPIRNMLMQGDLRPLYWAWLAFEFEDEAVEPPVPAGLDEALPAFDAFAEFYELPDDLVTAASQQAPPLPFQPDRNDAIKKWIGKRTKPELAKIAFELATGDAMTVQANLQKRAREAVPSVAWPMTKSTRTRAELQEIADSLEVVRVNEEAAAMKRKRAKHLKMIGVDPEKIVKQIESLAGDRTRDSYHKINKCLTDLAEALGDPQGPQQAKQIAQKLRQRKPRSNVLIGILREGNWLE